MLDSATSLPPRSLDPRRDDVATVLTRGLDALGPYLTGYLPSLVLACTLTPLTWIVILVHDPTSAWIVLVTLPLIPVFMILIGLLTKGRSVRTLAAMTTLSSRMLDLLAGLPTLRALGRERGPDKRVRELGEHHRTTTMSALRIAFLSSMVLELLATLSVALVAVSIGLRLVYGGMDLTPGIIALVLAPEVYLPLRMVGQRFHAAEDGIAAANRAFGIIDEARAAPRVRDAGTTAAPPRATIVLTDVAIATRHGFAPDGVSARLRPGHITVFTGANGSGKSTVLQAILGLTEPDRGSVTVGGVALADLDRESWWHEVAWLPQRPALVPGTVRENVEAMGPVDDLDSAAAAAGFDDVLRELPEGWDTMLGSEGVGLSLGQRQRLALTRVLASPKQVLLLDEPTAHLDDESERVVLDAVRERAAQGRTIVLVAHRPSLVAVADVVVVVRSTGDESDGAESDGAESDGDGQPHGPNGQESQGESW
ncbi:transport ATP-binding protein CydD [Rhodococcus rhodnii LMG 5362]|uniref:Transport ATP-binding protein CydD n=1 Tax=Rhodococcus rhodnii LMG 5362 TaxID=1273125 RepID=R7WGY5_9NOCA|nr:transport ATP-binding protein CydD [Rhodococcus rhodnii LMG 5362]